MRVNIAAASDIERGQLPRLEISRDYLDRDEDLNLTLASGSGIDIPLRVALGPFVMRFVFPEPVQTVGITGISLTAQGLDNESELLIGVITVNYVDLQLANRFRRTPKPCRVLCTDGTGGQSPCAECRVNDKVVRFCC